MTCCILIVIADSDWRFIKGVPFFYFQFMCLNYWLLSPICSHHITHQLANGLHVCILPRDVSGAREASSPWDLPEWRQYFIVHSVKKYDLASSFLDPCQFIQHSKLWHEQLLSPKSALTQHATRAVKSPKIFHFYHPHFPFFSKLDLLTWVLDRSTWIFLLVVPIKL